QKTILVPSSAGDSTEQEIILSTDEELVENLIEIVPAADQTEAIAKVEDPEVVKNLRPGKIAIILDDGGYGGEATRQALMLNNLITLSILPDTPFAGSTAKDALNAGFEVMLHMPMQSSATTTIHTFPGELKLDMTREEIHQRTLECMEQFPGAIGVNNHTGTAFTMDADRVEWFLEVVKEHELFFVDSRTTWESCAYDLASKMDIPCARRNIFLDNSSDPDEIRKYLAELVARARMQGTAVGIGHFRVNTIAVLKEELPKMKEINIELIRISEVVR
ncbi:MAG: divergent polysaccharide deacetylase family protein, partial [Candidatus Hydrogenedentes bacterium]|nr:divergent polysaccharide deacetylase family protein [Candidatus Hydrogenedentota bacterium]